MASPNDTFPNSFYNNQTNSSQPYPGYQAQTNARQTANRQSDYMSYPSQGYNGQGTYGQQQQQDGSWSNNRAAEAVRNLSNTAYTTDSNTAVSSSGFTPANAPTTECYSNPVAQALQNQYGSTSSTAHTTQTQTAQASHGQPQARPRSVNATASTRAPAPQAQGLPSPAVTAGFPSQGVQSHLIQHRSGSPTHIAYPSNQTSTNQSSKKQSSSTSSTQYTDHSHRTLPNVTEAPRTSLPPVASSPYNHGDHRQATAPAVQATTSQFQQPAITVDPMQIYDPWPEYQRKQEAVRAQKAAEDAVLAEKKRKEDEVKRIEEARKKAEEKKTKAEEQRRTETQRCIEEERRAREPQVPVPESAPVPPEKKPGKPRAPKKATASASATTALGAASASGSGPDLEAEIRAMMAKMRELNSKDPALLAKIWKQERKDNVTTQTKSEAPSPVVQTGQVPRKQSQNAATMKGSKAAPGSSANAASTAQSVSQPPARAPAVQAPTHPPQVQQTHTLAQTLKPVRQQGGTIWPPDKKVPLAVTASGWLNQIPENKDKQTTGDQILRMLDSNPSFIELCEKLENLGLKLERAAFARSLLAAVPDVNSASRQSAQAAPRPALANAQPNGGSPGPANPARNMGTVVQLVHKNYAHAQNGSTTGQVENAPPESKYLPPEAAPLDTPYYRTYAPIPGENSPGPILGDGSPPPLPAPLAQMVPKQETPKALPKPLANKEEAARKRDFCEFVDLTALSDEDNLPPVKKLKADQNFPRLSFSGSAPLSATDLHAPSPNFGNIPLNISQPGQTEPRGTMTPPVKDPRFSNIVQAINKKKVLRRSAYDIKTIARDVLLATGRHPEMRPLNAHLDILKQSFAEVDNTSDLSTLRWDIIDPGEIPKGYLQNSLGTQEDDAVDEDDSDDENTRARARPQVGVTQAIGVAGVPGTSSFAAVPSFDGLIKAALKRRGRPPRASYPVMSRPHGFGEGDSSNSNPRANRPPPNRAANTDRLTTSRPARSNGPSGTPTTSGRPTATSSAPRPSDTGYAAPGELNADGTPVKKRVRTVGWRKAINGSAESQGRVGSGQSSGLRNVSTVVDANSPSTSKGTKSAGKMRAEPNYQVYKCKWQLCTAELHNLETLRKHVHKIHGKAAAHGGFDCLWEACGKDITVHDKRTGKSEQRHQYFDFSNYGKWREHIELKHFGPLAWTMGDGPPSGLSDAHNSEADMSDQRARRVTPRISAPSSLNDSPGTGRAGSSLAPDPPRRGRRPKPSQEQVAQETEDSMLKKKRDVGPGVDKGGARLVTPKRRRGFNDSEDFDEMIVDKED